MGYVAIRADLQSQHRYLQWWLGVLTAMIDIGGPPIAGLVLVSASLYQFMAFNSLVSSTHAKAEQRRALDSFLRGGETREAAEHWWV